MSIPSIPNEHEESIKASDLISEQRKPLTSITASQARELLEAYKKAELSCMAKELLEVLTGEHLNCSDPSRLCCKCPAWLEEELERYISEGYIASEYVPEGMVLVTQERFQQMIKAELDLLNASLTLEGIAKGIIK